MDETNREIYLKEALRYFPRLLHLLDTNEFHESYGCFDREYWHYKRTDFPCGMNQEYVLAMALLFKNEFSGNPFYCNERIEQLIFSSIDFARRSSHRDSSCDSFYPYERALGATVFSLYACSEAYLLMGKKEEKIESFFKKRARWITAHGEKGILANHHAIAATCLLNVFLITKEEEYLHASEKKLKGLLSLQNSEGWFPEYGECDPGYLTITIDFLAKYYKKRKVNWLLEPLKKAIQFCYFFMHPDGSYGGEYGSRNTCIFLPHGFEIMRPLISEAGELAERNMVGLKLGKAAIFDDDRIFCHLMYNHLQSYLECKRTQEIKNREDNRDNFVKYFKEACLYVSLLKPYYLVLGLGKGGTAKLYKEKELIYSDTGFIGELSDRTKVSSQVFDRSRKVQVGGNKISVEGNFYAFSHTLLSPYKNILFRLLLITCGRLSFSRDLVRAFLQKKLILFKKKTPVIFHRSFMLEKSGLKVMDTITYKENKNPLIKLKIGSDHTCSNSAAANVHQRSSLLPWIDLASKLEFLQKEGEIKDERHIS